VARLILELQEPVWASGRVETVRRWMEWLRDVTSAEYYGALWQVWEHHEGFAFAATTVTIASCIISIFADLYPNLMVSSTSPAYNLTVHNSASGNYSLTVMTVVVIIFLPVVLAYQTWTYYVFRRRVSRSEFQPAPEPQTASVRRN